MSICLYAYVVRFVFSGVCVFADHGAFKLPLTRVARVKMFEYATFKVYSEARGTSALRSELLSRTDVCSAALLPCSRWASYSVDRFGMSVDARIWLCASYCMANKLVVEL